MTCAYRNDMELEDVHLLGDFGGGGTLLAFGVVCGLWEAGRSGQGQVVDAAMVDGASLLSSMIWGMRAMGHWTDERGTNLLDDSLWHHYLTCELSQQVQAVGLGKVDERRSVDDEPPATHPRAPGEARRG